MNKLTWTTERALQLVDACNLLFEVSQLNNGSNIIGHLTHCVSVAERLTMGKDDKPSFVDFIKQTCVDDRVAHHGEEVPQ